MSITKRLIEAIEALVIAPWVELLKGPKEPERVRIPIQSHEDRRRAAELQRRLRRR